MFIINTKASNNVMERIEYFCERVDRMEKSIIFSIVICYEKGEDKDEMMKEMEYYKTKLQKLNDITKYVKCIFSICNLNVHNDTEEVAKMILNSCIDNSCEISYAKLLNDILSKKINVEKVIQTTELNELRKEKKRGKESCFLM